MKNATTSLLLAASLCATAGAATVTGSTAAASGSYDLTTFGTTDWAYWSTTDGSGNNGLPANSKSGATTIGGISVIGVTTDPATTASLRGSSGSNVANTFSWDLDGTSPATGSSSNVRGIFSTQLDAQNSGMNFNITIPTTDTYELRIWTATFGGTGTLTASFDGGTTALYTSPGEAFESGSPKGSFLHTLIVTADAPGATLNIRNLLTADSSTTGNSHVLFSGAAIRPVPEPSAALLLGALSSLFLLRKKR